MPEILKFLEFQKFFHKSPLPIFIVMIARESGGGRTKKPRNRIDVWARMGAELEAQPVQSGAFLRVTWAGFSSRGAPVCSCGTGSLFPEAVFSLFFWEDLCDMPQTDIITTLA